MEKRVYSSVIIVFSYIILFAALLLLFQAFLPHSVKILLYLSLFAVNFTMGSIWFMPKIVVSLDNLFSKKEKIKTVAKNSAYWPLGIFCAVVADWVLSVMIFIPFFIIFQSLYVLFQVYLVAISQE